MNRTISARRITEAAMSGPTSRCVHRAVFKFGFAVKLLDSMLMTAIVSNALHESFGVNAIFGRKFGGPVIGCTLRARRFVDDAGCDVARPKKCPQKKRQNKLS